MFVDNKRKAEVVELDNDGDSTSDEECNIPNPYSLFMSTSQVQHVIYTNR